MRMIFFQQAFIFADNLPRFIVLFETLRVIYKDAHHNIGI